MFKADLHIHTEYSLDCNTPLEKIIERCLELGINCIAIADHGTAEGALKMQGMAPFTVIVAEETIPSGLSIEETITRIRAQHGLVCIPHPFDTIRGSALGGKVAEQIVEQIDILEVFNSRSPLLRSSAKSLEFAEKYGIVKSAGSDAHTIAEIGHAYLEMPEFSGRDDFLQALAQGTIKGHKTSLLRHFNSTWARLKSYTR